MKKKMMILLSLPKSFYFNIKVLGLKKGIMMPILLRYNTKIKEMHKNSIQIDSNIKFGMIKIGINHGTEGVLEERKRGYIKVEKKSKLIFKGKADLKNGCTIMATYGGQIIFGKSFTCNRGCFLSSDSCLRFGDDVMLGWNIHIRTSDGHPIYYLNQKENIINPNKEVKIGNHVWIGSNAVILKGVNIPNDCIIAFNACVTKGFNEEHKVIAGCPAKIVKDDITWGR